MALIPQNEKRDETQMFRPKATLFKYDPQMRNKLDKMRESIHDHMAIIRDLEKQRLECVLSLLPKTDFQFIAQFDNIGGTDLYNITTKSASPQNNEEFRRIFVNHISIEDHEYIDSHEFYATIQMGTQFPIGCKIMVSFHYRNECTAEIDHVPRFIRIYSIIGYNPLQLEIIDYNVF